MCMKSCCCIVRLTAMRIALSLKMAMTCAAGSRTSITMPDSWISGACISYSRATSIGVISSNGSASTNILAMFANA
ncbi:LOW QUALITY PROTEIN: Hypothetical protein PHPALM_5912 [Phytophthora palmivora]|uniref:Secreted protein n=1 Tax=Phytophthora palmivora TaxID=4796 RepID=A0A2P4YG73_9STRA|nr:LOW QUALITY PROTEIN: Hypothetical protein PHPALM_5912 [Phytophthora palmivora]